MTLLNQLILAVVHSPRFIGHIPEFKAFSQANVVFLRNTVTASLTPEKGTADHTTFMLRISCRGPDWQLSFLDQVSSQFFAPLSTLECLDIREDRYPRLDWQKRQHGVWPISGIFILIFRYK